jgi:hypothetical protein
MRNLIISALVLFALACSCHALEAIKINQDSSMSILASITPNPVNQSENATISQNQTNNTTATSLWSWGKIPMGYKLNKNGSLIKLADEQWSPSI